MRSYRPASSCSRQGAPLCVSRTVGRSAHTRAVPQRLVTPLLLRSKERSGEGRKEKEGLGQPGGRGHHCSSLLTANATAV